MNDIDRIAMNLDLSIYKEDVIRFGKLMHELHPSGCVLKTEMVNSGEHLITKIPIIFPVFINEMNAKYNDPNLALALLERIKNEYKLKN